jgi:hypothetical protein
MSGKYMIVVGGFGRNSSFNEDDEWNQGIGVFDTSTLTWASEYGGPSKYETPQLVRAWYENKYVLRQIGHLGRGPDG